MKENYLDYIINYLYKKIYVNFFLFNFIFKNYKYLIKIRIEMFQKIMNISHTFKLLLKIHNSYSFY